jgi:hypothetical protein
MRIKNFKLFESLTENDLEDVKDLFSDIVDLKYDYFKIRNGDGSQYQKVFDVQFAITESGNIVVRVICDLLYHYAITEDIKKEIYPRLKNLGLIPVSLKNQEIKSDSVRKIVPSSTGGFASTFDNKRLITLLIKVS